MYQIEVTDSESGEKYRPMSLRNLANYSDAQLQLDSFLTMNRPDKAEIVKQEEK